ncbi:major facilitator superfamily domain-containing protein [Hyaloraphidium curvatum]|nr:major facilitator superfamily domain-containing protein [Hyaloraphidium curvatum]
MSSKEPGEAAADPPPDAPATPPTPQPEGLRAWIVLIATFLAMFFSYGTSFSQGVWQRYFYAEETFGPQSQKALAWVGSIAYACSTLLGIFVGRASDILGHQRVFCFGTALFSLSWLASSFAAAAGQLWALYLTQGFMYGLGIACLLIPSGGVLVTHWRPERRALAIGLGGTGGGVGGFVWPLVIQALLDSVGPAWAYRVMALVSAVVLGTCTLVLQPVGVRPFGAPSRVAKKPKFFDPMFFRSKHYWILSAVGFWITWGYYIPTYYLPQYSTDQGLSPGQASLMISIMNIAGLVFRVAQGFLARLLEPASMFAGGIGGAALVQFLVWPFAKNLGSIIAFSLLYGTFATGAYHGLYPVVVANAFPDHYASAIGLIYSWCCIPGLAGPVLVGYLFDTFSSYAPDGARTTNYIPIQMFGGSMILVASACAWAEVWMLGREKRMRAGSGEVVQGAVGGARDGKR